MKAFSRPSGSVIETVTNLSIQQLKIPVHVNTSKHVVLYTFYLQQDVHLDIVYT